MFPDIQGLLEGLDATEQDARTLVRDLGEDLGRWRPASDAWNVAQCLDHLAVSNRVYLSAMQRPVGRAREQGRVRRGPAAPGLIGRWFVRYLEPPVRPRRRIAAPTMIVPRAEPTLGDAFARFCESQNDVRTFLHAVADLDLTGIRFPNPFIRGVRFSLATGFHVILAHERRHLWQAWRVRRGAEAAHGRTDATSSARAIA